VAGDIPADMEGLVAEKRRELIETVSEVDDVLAEKFLNDEPVSASELEVCSFSFVLKANSLHETYETVPATYDVLLVDFT